MTRNERRRIRYKERRAGAPVRYRWDRTSALTEKQMEVVELLMQDKSPKEAAVMLKLKDETVAEGRLRQARRAMGVRTTYGLLAKLFRRDLNRVIASLYILFVAATAGAADHWILVQTNLAEVLGPAVQLRSFVEPQTVTLIKTNILEDVEETKTGRRVRYRTFLVTNETIKFIYNGKEVSHEMPTQLGLPISERFVDIPVPLPANGATNIQLRIR